MTTVLFVAGAGRSGSTLLSSVLGQSTGVVDVGEVWKMWRLRQEPDRFCGCGSRLDACPFWEAVATASPGLYDPDPEVMVAMARIGHARGSWRLWAQLKAGRGGVDAYAERLGRLYRSVAEVSGGAQGGPVRGPSPRGPSTWAGGICMDDPSAGDRDHSAAGVRCLLSSGLRAICHGAGACHRRGPGIRGGGEWVAGLRGAVDGATRVHAFDGRKSGTILVCAAGDPPR